MSNANKKCSYCGEEIPAEAGRCPFCGSLLDVVVDIDSTPLNTLEQPVYTFVNDAEEQDASGTNVSEPSENIPLPAAQPGIPAGHQPAQPRVPAPQPSYSSAKNPLSNGMKVFLTLLFSFIPGAGQLAGLITAIVFMNTDDDPDRKSFGVALLIAMLIMFVLSCISCFLVIMVFSLYSSNVYTH